MKVKIGNAIKEAISLKARAKELGDITDYSVTGIGTATNGTQFYRVEWYNENKRRSVIAYRRKSQGVS